jgi:hypothetical protein
VAVRTKRFDPATDGEGGEYGCQVSLDRVARVVVDRSGLQVALAIWNDFSDLEELVVGADHELGGDRVPSGRSSGW